MNMSISPVEDVAAEPQREGGLRVLLSDGVVRDVAASPGHSVMELIRTEMKAREIAAIVVTHDERMVHYADRVAHILDGRLQG